MNDASSVVGSGNKPVIGLIGGVGSGKSTVARFFAELGCAVIDADQLARQALETEPVKRQLVAWWGPGVLDDAGRVHRRAVARIVFGDDVQRARLEGLVHPRVHEGRAELRARYQADPSVVAIVEDCPLLLETGLAAQCDVVIFVAASWETRVARVAASRQWSEADLRMREKSQLALDIKARRADYVLDNDAGETQTRQAVRRVLSQIIQEHDD